jgi:hypothetical protein
VRASDMGEVHAIKTAVDEFAQQQHLDVQVGLCERVVCDPHPVQV